MGVSEHDRNAIVVKLAKIFGQLRDDLGADGGKPGVRLEREQQCTAVLLHLVDRVQRVLPGLAVVGNVGELHGHRRGMAEIRLVLRDGLIVPIEIDSEQHALFGNDQAGVIRHAEFALGRRR